MESTAAAFLILSLLMPGARPEESTHQTVQGDQVRLLTTWSHAIPDSAGVFYSPVSEHFRWPYELDRLNRPRQRWQRYWSWVQTFYEGNLLARGWTEQCGRILDALPGAFHPEDLIGRMNVLGRLVAAEWAKNNALRRISTRDLRQWGALLRRAIRKRDPDDPVPVLEAFNQVEVAVYQRLSPLTRRFNRSSGS